jgi:hypothetical protein
MEERKGRWVYPKERSVAGLLILTSWGVLKPDIGHAVRHVFP